MSPEELRAADTLARYYRDRERVLWNEVVCCGFTPNIKYDLDCIQEEAEKREALIAEALTDQEEARCPHCFELGGELLDTYGRVATLKCTTCDGQFLAVANVRYTTVPVAQPKG